MQIPGTNPEAGVNLTRLRDAFDEDQYAALESIFRAITFNTRNIQKTSNYVTNWNSLKTYATADLPADGGDQNNTAVIEDTGSGYNLVLYTNNTHFTLSTSSAVPEAWPVGSIFVSVDNTNPATTIGYGTWTAFGAGKTLVGLDSGDTDFDTVEETGGAKTHTLVESEMPTHTHVQDAHTHTQNSHNHSQTNGTLVYRQTGTAGIAASTGIGALAVTISTLSNVAATATNQNTTATNQNTGGGGAHNNLQPYIVVYFWKRTA